MSSVSSSIIALVSGLASIVLMLVAFRRNPSDILRLIFIVWVSFPFALLGVGNLVAKRWAARTRSTLQYVTLVVSIVSVVIYLYVVLRPAKAQGAFAFIALPPISAMLIVLVVATIASMRIRKA